MDILNVLDVLVAGVTAALVVAAIAGLFASEGASDAVPRRNGEKDGSADAVPEVTEQWLHHNRWQ